MSSHEPPYPPPYGYSQPPAGPPQQPYGAPPPSPAERPTVGSPLGVSPLSRVWHRLLIPFLSIRAGRGLLLPYAVILCALSYYVLTRSEEQFLRLLKLIDHDFSTAGRIVRLGFPIFRTLEVIACLPLIMTIALAPLRAMGVSQQITLDTLLQSTPRTFMNSCLGLWRMGWRLRFFLLLLGGMLAAYPIFIEAQQKQSVIVLYFFALGIVGIPLIFNLVPAIGAVCICASGPLPPAKAFEHAALFTKSNRRFMGIIVIVWLAASIWIVHHFASKGISVHLLQVGFQPYELLALALVAWYAISLLGWLSLGGCLRVLESIRIQAIRARAAQEQAAQQRR